MALRATILCENMVRHMTGTGEHGFSALKQSGRENIYSVLGGTHLDFLAPEQLEKSITSLREMPIQMIVSHCTGMNAALRLRQEFGDRFFYGCAGSVLEA